MPPLTTLDRSGIFPFFSATSDQAKNATMQLSIVLAVVAAFVISENAADQPVASVTWRLCSAMCAAALVVLFAALGSWTVSRRLKADFQRGKWSQRRKWLCYFDKFRCIHLALWLSISGWILYGLQWPQLVRYNGGFGEYFLLDELLILIPVLLPLIASWAAFYQVDRTLQKQSVAASGSNRLVTGRGKYLLLHVQHYLGLVLLPVLVVVALLDCAKWWLPKWAEAELVWPLFLAPMVIVFIAIPLLIRVLWRTESLPPGPLRRRLESAASRAGLKVRDILIWNTSGRIVNAAVAGLIPRLRYVLLSDGLMERLSDEEVEAVFLHEAAHVRRWHLSLRVLVLCLPLVIFLCLEAVYPQAWEQLTAHFSSLGVGPQFVNNLLAPLCVTLYTVPALGWCSRLLEHDADLWACRFLAQRVGQSASASAATESYISAFEKLSHASGANLRRGSWLHPSFESRAQLLRRTMANPNPADR